MYNYVPGSIEAHDRSMRPVPPAEAPEDACRILVPQRVAEGAEIPPDARKLMDGVEWSIATYAVAERVATMELVPTCAVWLRHRGVAACVVWTDGRAPRCVVRAPYPHVVTFEQLRVMLGLLVIEYGGCARCGAVGVRLKGDGTPRAHKRVHGPGRGEACK